MRGLVSEAIITMREEAALPVAIIIVVSDAPSAKRHVHGAQRGANKFRHCFRGQGAPCGRLILGGCVLALGVRGLGA